MNLSQSSSPDSGPSDLRLGSNFERRTCEGHLMFIGCSTATAYSVDGISSDASSMAPLWASETWSNYYTLASLTVASCSHTWISKTEQIGSFIKKDLSKPNLHEPLSKFEPWLRSFGPPSGLELRETHMCWDRPEVILDELSLMMF